MAGSGGRGFVLASHKVTMCMLMRAYAAPSSASPPFCALPSSARHRLALFLLDQTRVTDGFLEPTFEELGEELKDGLSDVGGMLFEQLGSRLPLLVTPEGLKELLAPVSYTSGGGRGDDMIEGLRFNLAVDQFPHQSPWGAKPATYHGHWVVIQKPQIIATAMAGCGRQSLTYSDEKGRLLRILEKCLHNVATAACRFWRISNWRLECGELAGYWELQRRLLSWLMYCARRSCWAMGWSCCSSVPASYSPEWTLSSSPKLNSPPKRGLWGAWKNNTPNRAKNLRNWGNYSAVPCNNDVYYRTTHLGWSGVGCHFQRNATSAVWNASVLMLNLRNVSIVGVPPPEVSLLSNLQYLYLRGNPALSGPIPKEIGLLSSLTTLAPANGFLLTRIMPQFPQE